jgi:sirohydrochlorin ferrochelatase
MRRVTTTLRDPTTAVLLIAHGSRQTSANEDLFELAERIADRERYAIVEACFLELAQPDIPEAVARCVARGARKVLMIPYFLSAGVHLNRDLSQARDQAAHDHPGTTFLLAPALGPHPLLDQLVVTRINDLDRF